MRVALGLLLLAACARHRVAAPSSPTTKTTSALEPFAAGVMQRTISEHIYGDLWEATRATLELVRDGQVVCSVPDGGHGAGCLDSWSDGVAISVASDLPLRFSARDVRSTRHTFGHSPGTCVGYELPATGSCRKIFEHDCAIADRCTTNVMVTRRPGNARIVVSSTARAEVLFDRASAQIIDATSPGELAAGPGIHALEIFIDSGAAPEIVSPLWLAPYEDLDVFVDHRCHCCEL